MFKPGDQIGQWTVLEFSDHGKYKYYWKCRCSCGTVKDVQQCHLSHGKSTKCTTCKSQGMNNSRYSHGKADSRIYKNWHDMKARCENPKNSAYKYYGGRGIQVCERWQDFNLFYSDMGDPPSSELSIDRIDVNGNYAPDNCRWATAVEQARNRRDNRMLTFDGKTMCLTDWAAVVGISGGAISDRLKRGWSVQRALTEGLCHSGVNFRFITIDGETNTIAGWSRKTGIHEATIKTRLKAGWDERKAIFSQPQGKNKST
jgi:hypothetical protein